MLIIEWLRIGNVSDILKGFRSKSVFATNARIKDEYNLCIHYEKRKKRFVHS